MSSAVFSSLLHCVEIAGKVIVSVEIAIANVLSHSLSS